MRVVVENTQGDIFDAKYLATLQKVNDALFFIPGTERAWLKSLWTPVVRWTEVTEEGLQGGPVMPDDFDASARAIQQLRLNVGRAGIVGNLVANDLRSSVVVVPLMARLENGQPLDYAAYARALEDVRTKFERDGITIHIIGFAKLVGDLIDGLLQVMMFFGVAAAIAGVIIGLHTRCWRSTLLLIASALLGVLWLLGLMHLLGFELDPYSILVPFLVFAIGMSHGAQKMNGIMQDIGRGTHKYVAARYTFPAPVRRRADGAADRRGRLRRADGHRHPGDPRAGVDGQHRRGGADLHQPGAAADAAVVPGGEPECSAPQPARRRRRSRRQRHRPLVEHADPLHRAALGHSRAVGGGAAVRDRRGRSA